MLPARSEIPFVFSMMGGGVIRATFPQPCLVFGMRPSLDEGVDDEGWRCRGRGMDGVGVGWGRRFLLLDGMDFFARRRSGASVWCGC